MQRICVVKMDVEEKLKNGNKKSRNRLVSGFFAVNRVRKRWIDGFAKWLRTHELSSAIAAFGGSDIVPSGQLYCAWGAVILYSPQNCAKRNITRSKDEYHCKAISLAEGEYN